MRFGIFFPQLKEQIRAKANIWVHAVSVGEVMVLDGFIDQLRKRYYPAYQVIASVTTKTGYDACLRTFKGQGFGNTFSHRFQFCWREAFCVFDQS
jgi:3-deoxy-D-manno-octulosonic-acid transferase